MTTQIAQFETGRLSFRPMSMDDVNDLSHIFCAEVFQNVPGISWPIEVEKWVDEKINSPNAYLCHTITSIDENTLVGFIELYDGAPSVKDDYFAIELGYLFGKDYWNKGYCSEMLTAITKHIIEPNNWTQEVVAFVSEQNIASIKALNRAGFEDSGVRREIGECETCVYLYESEFFKSMKCNHHGSD